MQKVEEREVYVNAPVVLVALEVRHPAAAPLSTAQRIAFKSRLSKRTPIMRSGQMQQVTTVGGATPDLRVEEFPRYFSRDTSVVVSVRSEATVIETTRYGRWEKLLSLAADVYRAREEIAPVDGVERIGLRYIDEIRVPVTDDAIDWTPWVDPTVLGPTTLATELKLINEQWQGIAAFRPADDDSLVLRFGPRVGYAVEPGGELRRTAPPPGPFFLIDIDSFWTPSEEVPEFSANALLETCNRLHNPVRSLFERLITDRLRVEVLRRDRRS